MYRWCDIRADEPTLPLLGINFSHRHAAWLGLDPDALYLRLLDELRVRHVRLSVYWDEVAPSADKLTFAPVRRWLDPLQERGGKALVTLGLKGQRWPEFYPPEWLTEQLPIPHGASIEEQPRVVAHLILLLERLTAFLADYDAIDSWQVENEPFLPGSTTAGWRITSALLQREIDVVAEADPRGRPIIVNHSTQNRLDRRWWTALQPADALAENVYSRKPNRWPWPRYFNTYAMWLLAPSLRREARVASMLGKELWVTELQAEPWEREDQRDIAPERIGSISPRRIEQNLRLVTRAGARRVYFWGAEWWRFMAEQRADARYWDLARSLFSSQTPARRRP